MAAAACLFYETIGVDVPGESRPLIERLLPQGAAMPQLRNVSEDQLRRRIQGLEIIRIDNALILEHRNASHFLAELDMSTARLTVPVTAEFRDHPEYDGHRLVDRAMEVLEPRIRHYVRRGYHVRETEFLPGAAQPSNYEKPPVPTFVAYLDRRIDDVDELPDELEWLLGQLPAK